MFLLKKIRRMGVPLAVLVAPALLISALAQDQVEEDLVMNFRNVDIRQIIESVGEVTGKNFLIDPRVRAKVTIIANEPVPRDALYDVLMSILRMHGFRAVENIGITRIVPANLGGRYASNNIPEGLVTEIIRIQHLNSASVIPLIKPMMTPQAQVLNHKETNNLIITETKANLERAKTILARLDVPSIASYDIIPLQNLDAATMHKVLQRVSNKNLRHLVEIVADRDANRIIMTGPEELRLRLRSLIADMDTPSAAAGLSGTIQIIALRYAKAEEMATLLKNLFSSSAFLKNLGGQGSYAFTDRPAPAAKKGKKQPVKKKPAPKAARGKKEDARNYTIQFDEETNSLIVGGPPKIIEAAQYIISRLDVPRPQVLIEAIVADISADQMARFNSELGQRVIRDDENDRVTGIEITGANYTGVVAALSQGSITLGGVEVINGAPITFLIDALRTDSNTNILSTPSILTLNNQEASIDVADTRYVQIGQTTAAGGGTTTSRNKEEFGTLLKVTPQITEGDAVRLELEQITESIDQRSLEAAFPTSRKREIKTSVLVNDSNILVLGGLIQNRRIEEEQRVPILSSIPILGNLFKDRNSSNRGNTLMIFIKPTILRTPEESFDMSKEIYASIRLEQLLYGEEIESLLKKGEIKDASVLPQIENGQATAQPRGSKAASKQQATPAVEEAQPAPKRKIIRRVIRRKVVEKGT